MKRSISSTLLGAAIVWGCGKGGEPAAPAQPAPPPSPDSEMQSWISVVRLKDHKPRPPKTPIASEREAIDFALGLPDVKAKIAPLETWWGKAQKRAKEHPNRWFISFGQGDNACNTFFQCTLQVESDGAIVYPLACTEGWNCK